MKRLFLIGFFAVLFFNVKSQAQDSTFTSKTKIGIFSGNKGMFIKKEYVPIGEIKLFAFSVIKITDLESGRVMYGAIVEKKKNDGFQPVIASVYLDSSEVNSLYKFLMYLKKETSKDVQFNVKTSFSFITEDGFSVSSDAKADGRSTYFILINNYWIPNTERLSHFTSQDNLDEFIRIFSDMNDFFKSKRTK